MLGRMMLRGARKMAQGGSKSKAEKAPTVPWSAFKSHAGQWAILIFATMFIGCVVLIGWYVDYASTHY